MSSVVIAGAQWGDEGKGKVVDVLTEGAEIVARYQGGHNAGHTVVIGEKQFILHLVPSGILHRGTLSLIGNGTVVEPAALIKELDGLKANGLDVTRENLLISSRAHLIMPYHIALDGANEKKRGSGKIGTTGRGIGPAYVEKMARTGLQVGDLLVPDVFREKLARSLGFANEVLTKIYGMDAFDEQQIFDTYMGYAKRLGGLIADVSVVLDMAIRSGKNVLFEGAQGALLDIDHGTYPFVTSSSATAGGVCTGLGVGPTKIDKALAIVKAYTTRVGEGPFPTELFDEVGQGMQKRGAEFGATTGRPRRCGWLDMVALRHSVRINGFTGIVLTKLDILSGVDELKICTAYDLDGRRVEDFPSSAQELARCKPIYEFKMKGWQDSTAGVTDYQALPAGARDYIAKIEEMLGIPVDIVSTGARRDEIIIRNRPF